MFIIQRLYSRILLMTKHTAFCIKNDVIMSTKFRINGTNFCKSNTSPDNRSRLFVYIILAENWDLKHHSWPSAYNDNNNFIHIKLKKGDKISHCLILNATLN